MLAVDAVPALRTGAHVAALALLAQGEHAQKVNTAVGKRSAALIPEGDEDSSAARVAGRWDPTAARAIVRAAALSVDICCALRHVLERAGARILGIVLQLAAAAAASSSCHSFWRIGWLDDAGAAVLAGVQSLADLQWRRAARLLAGLQVDAASVGCALAREHTAAAAVGSR